MSLPQNIYCIFDDIIRLDFVKFKTTVTEYQDGIKEKKRAFNEKNKD